MWKNSFLVQKNRRSSCDFCHLSDRANLLFSITSRNWWCGIFEYICKVILRFFGPPSASSITTQCCLKYCCITRTRNCQGLVLWLSRTQGGNFLLVWVANIIGHYMVIHERRPCWMRPFQTWFWCQYANPFNGVLTWLHRHIPEVAKANYAVNRRVNLSLWKLAFFVGSQPLLNGSNSCFHNEHYPCRKSSLGRNTE